MEFGKRDKSVASSWPCESYTVEIWAVAARPLVDECMGLYMVVLHTIIIHSENPSLSKSHQDCFPTSFDQVCTHVYTKGFMVTITGLKAAWNGFGSPSKLEPVEFFATQWKHLWRVASVWILRLAIYFGVFVAFAKSESECNASSVERRNEPIAL